MRNRKYKDYNFDYDYEYKLYASIGKYSNREGKRKLFFSRYSEWKNYLEQTYTKQKDYDDFYRFLRKELRFRRSLRDITKTSIIPTELVVFTSYFSINENYNIISACIITLMILILFSVMIFRADNEVNFMEDLIEVLFDKVREK